MRDGKYVHSTSFSDYDFWCSCDAAYDTRREAIRAGRECFAGAPFKTAMLRKEQVTLPTPDVDGLIEDFANAAEYDEETTESLIDSISVGAKAELQSSLDKIFEAWRKKFSVAAECYWAVDEEQHQ